MGRLTKAGFARAKTELGLKGKLSRKQVQRVFKHAIKKLGRKLAGKKRKSRKTRASNPKKKVKRRMARKKKRRGGGKSIMRTAEKFMKVGVFLAPGVRRGGDVMRQTGDIGQAFVTGVTTYGGIRRDGKFDWKLLAEAWTPYLAFVGASALAHKAAAIIRRL